jgi:flagellar biogenesis protein FliO
MTESVLPAPGQPWWRTWLHRWAAWNQRHRRARRLHVIESVALGEKRFVAVVQFEQQRFLVGGTGGSLSLLAELKSEETGRMMKAHASEES